MSSRVWAFVVSPSLTSSSLSRVPLHLLLFLHLLYLRHHPSCGRNRRVLNPQHTRRMRSIAPWRYTTLSQMMELYVLTTWQKSLSQGLVVLGNGQLKLGSLSWQKEEEEEEEDRRKGVSTAWTPDSSKHFLYFRVIQGTFRRYLSLILRCKTMSCCDDFAEYLQHIGNAHGTHSIIQGEPDVHQSRSGRSSIRSGQTQNRRVQK